MFVGYPRTGHSLIGSLLDAHPRIVIAHELDALELFQWGFSQRQVFHLLLENSRKMAAAGRSHHGYSYGVPNQWQVGRDKEIQKAVVSKVRFPCPSSGTLEHVPCPMLDGTLERSDQCMGVELSQCARQLCLLNFSEIEIRSNCDSIFVALRTFLVPRVFFLFFSFSLGMIASL